MPSSLIGLQIIPDVLGPLLWRDLIGTVSGLERYVGDPALYARQRQYDRGARFWRYLRRLMVVGGQVHAAAVIARRTGNPRKTCANINRSGPPKER